MEKQTMEHKVEALQDNLTILTTKGFNEKQITEIKEGLRHGLDVSVYKFTHFDADQMYQIRRGMEEGLDVDFYANPQLPFHVMSEMRTRLYHQKNRKLLNNPG